MLIICRFASSLGLVAVIFGACSKGSSSTNDPSGEVGGESEGSGGPGVIQISGQITLSGNATAPDKALAFPVNGGTFDRNAIATLSPTQISSGQLQLEISRGEGSLRLDEESADSHVLVTYTENADRFAAAESFRYVNLDTGNETAAVNILTSKLKEDQLDLGTLSGTGSDLTGSKPAAADSFNAPASAVQELAKTDDALKKVKNSFMNTEVDPNTRKILSYVDTTPGFMWQGPAGTLVNASLDVPANTNYAGYLMFFGAEHPSLSIDTLCNTTAGKLKMVPPVAVVSGATSITELNNDQMEAASLMNTGDPQRKSCSKATTSANSTGFGMFASGGKTGDTGNQVVGWNWNGTTSDGFSGLIPPGMWTMSFDGKTIAKFDLAAAFPFTADNNPLIYIPAIRATVDATTKVVQNFEVVFFLWDRPSSSLKRVEDLTALNEVMSQLSIGFFDFSSDTNGPRAEQSTGIPFPTEGYVFTASKSTQVSNNGWTYDWRLDGAFYSQQTDGGTGPTPTRTAESVSLGYKMYGNSYSFGFNLPACFCQAVGGYYSVSIVDTQKQPAVATEFPNPFTTLNACQEALNAKLLGAGTSACR